MAQPDRLRIRIRPLVEREYREDEPEFRILKVYSFGTRGPMDMTYEHDFIHLAEEWENFVENKVVEDPHPTNVVVSIHGIPSENGHPGRFHIYFFKDGIYNEIEDVRFELQDTQQTAILYAAKRAIEVTEELLLELGFENIKEIIIKTHSKFLVESLSKDIWTWLENDFSTADEEAQNNRRLIKSLHERILRAKNNRGAMIKFWLVKEIDNLDAVNFVPKHNEVRIDQSVNRKNLHVSHAIGYLKDASPLDSNITALCQYLQMSVPRIAQGEWLAWFEEIVKRLVSTGEDTESNLELLFGQNWDIWTADTLSRIRYEAERVGRDKLDPIGAKIRSDPGWRARRAEFYERCDRSRIWEADLADFQLNMKTEPVVREKRTRKEAKQVPMHAADVEILEEPKSASSTEVERHTSEVKSPEEKTSLPSAEEIHPPKQSQQSEKSTVEKGSRDEESAIPTSQENAYVSFLEQALALERSFQDKLALNTQEIAQNEQKRHETTLELQSLTHRLGVAQLEIKHNELEQEINNLQKENHDLTCFLEDYEKTTRRDWFLMFIVLGLGGFLASISF